jgi:hypothetical protein
VENAVSVPLRDIGLPRSNVEGGGVVEQEVVCGRAGQEDRRARWADADSRGDGRLLGLVRGRGLAPARGLVGARAKVTAAGAQLGLPLGVSRWLILSAAVAPALLGCALGCALGFRRRAVNGFDRLGSGGRRRLRWLDSVLRFLPPRPVAFAVALVSGAASPAS